MAFAESSGKVYRLQKAIPCGVAAGLDVFAAAVRGLFKEKGIPESFQTSASG